MDTPRHRLLAKPGLVIVKVGTNVLADGTGRLNHDRINTLTAQLVGLRQQGWRVVLVSSGAIGAGMGTLGLPHRPTELPALQACAAVGQQSLMQAYTTALARHRVTAGQLLLTASDFEHRARYLNMRNTLFRLFDYHCLPIINENDTVTVAEIKFGDNDHLAALVANLLQAKLLVLLSNVDGLYAVDPRENPTAVPLATVPRIDASILQLARSTKSQLGTGGMRSKLRAAELAIQGGTAVLLANGSQPDVLPQLFRGEPIGTLFLAQNAHLPAFKRWLGSVGRPSGTFVVDAGAKRALQQNGKSLLPVGLLRVIGQFSKGAIVEVSTEGEVAFARGLSNYTATEAAKLAGQKSEQLAATEGPMPYPELIHRDNLTLLPMAESTE